MDEVERKEKQENIELKKNLLLKKDITASGKEELPNEFENLKTANNTQKRVESIADDLGPTVGLQMDEIFEEELQPVGGV